MPNSSPKHYNGLFTCTVISLHCKLCISPQAPAQCLAHHHHPVDDFGTKRRTERWDREPFYEEMFSGSIWGIDDRGSPPCPSLWPRTGHSCSLPQLPLLGTRSNHFFQDSHKDQMLCVRKCFVIHSWCDQKENTALRFLLCLEEEF